MTTKQKCKKLADVLDVVATKLRDDNIGIKVWEAEEPSMQSLVAQIHIFLKKAIEIAEPTKKTSKLSKRNLSEDWPDIIE